MGSPAMTSRGLKEDDFQIVCEFIDRGIKITKEFNATVSGTFSIIFQVSSFIAKQLN